jgi:hypothetical protein
MIDCLISSALRFHPKDCLLSRKNWLSSSYYNCENLQRSNLRGAISYEFNFLNHHLSRRTDSSLQSSTRYPSLIAFLPHLDASCPSSVPFCRSFYVHRSINSYVSILEISFTLTNETLGLIKHLFVLNSSQDDGISIRFTHKF